MAGATAAATNEAGFAIDEETVFGVTDSGPPTLQDLNIVSESLRGTAEKTKSATIRNDRQITGRPETSVGAEGEVVQELQYEANPDLWEAVYGAASHTAGGTVVATTISVESIATSSTSNPKILDSANGFGSISVNDWIRLSGSTPGTNNQVMQVLVAGAGELEVRPTETTDLTDESAGASLTVAYNAKHVNGTACRSFTGEREHTDITVFRNWVGLVPGTGSLQIRVGEINRTTFGFQGKRETENVVATVGDGSNTAAPTTEFTNPISHINAILEAGVSIEVQEVRFEVNQNLRPRNVVGTKGPTSFGLGEWEVTGSLRVYFSGRTQLDKFLGDTSSSIAIVVQDSAGNNIIFDFPALDYLNESTPNEGANGDFTMTLDFGCKRDTTQGITSRMASIAA